MFSSFLPLYALFFLCFSFFMWCECAFVYKELLASTLTLIPVIIWEH
jgi:hypothetical protein